MRFMALDVETANADMASICSIGIATFESEHLVEETYWLIDPEDHFDPTNVSIHGIDASAVAGSPTFKHVSKKLDNLLSGTIIVTHTHFDRLALQRAAHRAKIEPVACNWIDTARVARRTWTEFAQRGYGLASVCNRIGYEFQHHHALEDAKASGHIMLAALRETGLDLEEMVTRCSRPIHDVPSSSAAIRRSGNPDGHLSGEVIAFTGALSLSRSEAADMAALAGCEVASGVTRETTLLVVGDTDARQLAGHEKSSKHRKAEGLIRQGHPMRIIGESDFRHLISLR